MAYQDYDARQAKVKRKEASVKVELRDIQAVRPYEQNPRVNDQAVTHGHGRDVQEWKLKPSRPDNHWLDCLVGCAVAASICGVKLPGMDARPGRQRKRYTQDDFRRKM
jgi:hypothetical protein